MICRWNCDLRVINAWKKAISVVLKASPWCSNHVTICLLCHSGESLQNDQLQLWRWNWYFARETHKDTAVSILHTCRILKEYRNIVSASKQTPCGIPWGFQNRTHWCGAARKSAHLNCINLIHFRLTAGQLHGSSCIVIPGVVCELLQFAATQ